MSFSEAASAWLRKNREALPEDVRPAPDESEEFSHLFVSYLSTSFEIVDNQVVGACGGCFCCGTLRPPRHLRARTPDAKARRAAEELKRVLLRRRAEDLELPLIEADLRTFVAAHEDLRIDLAAVALCEPGRGRAGPVPQVRLDAGRTASTRVPTEGGGSARRGEAPGRTAGGLGREDVGPKCC